MRKIWVFGGLLCFFAVASVGVWYMGKNEEITQEKTDLIEDGKKLTIYTLYDDYHIRALAESFSQSHEDIEVTVTYGLSGEDGVTISDALRTLNAELLSGNGPDIICLDGLNVDVYVENGLLADISALVEPLIASGAVFENIATTYRQTDGSIRGIPLAFTLPVIIGRQETLKKIDGLSDIADMAEVFALSENNGAFMDVADAITLMGTMMYVYAIEWFDGEYGATTVNGDSDTYVVGNENIADGRNVIENIKAVDKDEISASLNTEALTSYLQDIRRIYDAVYASLNEEDEEGKELYTQWQQYFSEDYDGWDLSAFGDDPSYDAVFILYGALQIAVGRMGCSDSLAVIASAEREDAEITYQLLKGNRGTVYTPAYTVGINSYSKSMDTAQSFIAYLLGSEAQEKLGRTGQGFPILTEVFEQLVQETSEEQKVYAYENENGEIYRLEIGTAGEEQVQELKALIAGANSASYGNYTVLSIILKYGYSYVMGKASIENVVSRIENAVNLYLAE